MTIKWNERPPGSPEFTRNIVSHGDSMSLTGSVQSIYAQRIVALVEGNQSGQVVKWTRCGINGASWNFAWSGAGYSETMLQDIPLRVAPGLSSTRPNWVILFAGTNGVILGGNSAAQEYAHFQTYITALLSNSKVAAERVIVNTMLPRTGLNETTRTDFNNSIVSGAATYGYKVARLDLNANIGAAGQDLNTTYFLDGTHPTDAGHAIIAQIVYGEMPQEEEEVDMVWTRPPDWPAMPASITNYIDILAAVTDDDSNFAAVKATVVGGYIVDWGDGVVENVASATQRDHKYVYSTLATPVTSRGYKTAMIRITPQGANPITAFDLGVKNATAGLIAYSNPWLDIQVNAPSCTSVAFRTAVEQRFVERINFVAIGAVTSLQDTVRTSSSLYEITFPAGSLASILSLSGTFMGCKSLLSLTFPAGSLGNLTAMTNIVNDCSALQSISFPSGSLGLVTNAAGAFANCSSIRSISLPSGSLSLVTTLANAFEGCRSLQSINFPAGSLGALLSVTQVFDGCWSLSSVSFPAGSCAAVTDASYAFRSCLSLKTVVFPAGALVSASATSFINMFQGCTALTGVTFPVGSLTGVTNISDMFNSCQSIQTLTFPAASLGSVTSANNSFLGCTNLERIVNCLIPVSFALPCNLSATELDEIYTSLPVVTAKTLTVSTNYGYATSTQSIATGKGWTLA